MASGGLCRQTSLKKKIHQTICLCSSSIRAQGMSSASLCRRVDCDDLSCAAGFSFVGEYFCPHHSESNSNAGGVAKLCLPCRSMGRVDLSEARCQLPGPLSEQSHR